MKQKTETTTDIQEMVVTKLDEAVKRIIEFEYYKCWDEVQDRLSDIKNAFNADYINELTDNMDGLQTAYFKLMDTGIGSMDLDDLSCCIPCESNMQFMDRYGELQIDKATLKMLAKMLS